MTDCGSALNALAGARHQLADVLPNLPSMPGLYAIYGDPTVWNDLGFGDPPDARPLYVGKAEVSLMARDMRTHFGTGRTGSSTVRRSFAALLSQVLDLHAMPRNPAKPGYYANYGLSPDDDARLTSWMRSNLEIAVWATDRSEPLVSVERQIIVRWKPPLNLTETTTPWTAVVKGARAAMAAEARSWAEDQ